MLWDSSSQASDQFNYATENKVTTICFKRCNDQIMDAHHPGLLSHCTYHLWHLSITMLSLTQPCGVRSLSHYPTLKSSGPSWESRGLTSPICTSLLELALLPTPCHITHYHASTPAILTATAPHRDTIA